MDDPVLAGIVLAVLGVAGEGLRRVWTALVAAIVRALDQLAPDHTGDDAELVVKVRQHGGRGRVDSLMTTMAPGSLIQRELARRKTTVPPPPEGE